MDWLDIKEFFKDTFKYILLIIIVLIVFIYIVSIQQVVGPSMSPTLKNGDIVLINKLNKNINRGDIITFNAIDSKYLIKRVIGLPGDTVEISNNKVIINGKILEERYLSNPINEDFSLSSMGYENVPEDYYFVLGDNRTDSMDSRDSKIGLVSKDSIIGKVIFRIWPINKMKIYK